MKRIIIILLFPILLFAASPKLKVTYFMTTYRCHSCHYIENMTEETLLKVFGNEMKDSTIIFQALNIDQPENKHYTKDYKLEFKAVVLEKMKDDSVVQWNRLDSLWNCIDKDSEFSMIIERGVKEYLAK